MKNKIFNMHKVRISFLILIINDFFPFVIVWRTKSDKKNAV